MDGCRLCNYQGCDDCMYETKVIMDYINERKSNHIHIKRKVTIKDDDMRLKKNRNLFVKRNFRISEEL